MKDMAYLEGDTELSSSDDNNSLADEKEYAEEVWIDKRYNGKEAINY